MGISKYIQCKMQAHSIFQETLIMRFLGTLLEHNWNLGADKWRTDRLISNGSKHTLKSYYINYFRKYYVLDIKT